MAITKTDGRTAIVGQPSPDFVTVYGRDGVARQKFPIDAKECVATGDFFYEKPSDEEIEAAQEAEVPEPQQPVQPEAGEEVGNSPKRRGRKPKGDS